MQITFRCAMIIGLAFVSLTCLSCQDEEVPTTNTEKAPDAHDVDLTDAYHDKMRTEPYPKGTNELYLNPTPLIVPLQMKGDALLQFALSTSADFDNAGTTVSEAKPWCMYNPHHELPAGTWHWRFRPVTADGTPGQWSRAYSFEVKEETPVFTTPPFTTFHKNAPRQHPRLFCFLDDRIDEARHNHLTHPEYKSLRSRAQQALAADPGVIGNPYSRISDVKTYIQSLYQAYHLTRQEEYAEGMHRFLKWLLEHPADDATLLADNFTTTDIAICHLHAYDLLYDRLTATEREACEALLMRVLTSTFSQHCGLQENHIFDNHFWQQNIRILFQTAFCLFDKAAYVNEVLPMLEYYYELWTARAPASGFNRDGIWHNGSGYFTANTTTLYYMPLLLSYVARADFMLHPWYRNAGQALLYTWTPGGKSSGFGDSSEAGNEPDRQRVAFADFLARETGDTYAGWYAKQCEKTLRTDIEMRLYRMASPRTYDTALPANREKYVWHRDAGEVTMHSDLGNTQNDLTLSFRSSTFASGSHTTASQNAFNLLYKGTNVYRSSGYYTKFSDAHNLMSYRHTRAHNTVLVNGIGQPYSTRGYGHVMRAMGGQHITYCLGDASRAYRGISDDPLWTTAFEAAGIGQTPENGFGITPLSKYRRHVLMLHPDAVIIYDELEASAPVRWEWLLHSPVKFGLSPEGDVFSTSNDERGFHATTQLFCSQAYTAAQTDAFRVPPTPVAGQSYPNQWHLTATVEGAERVRFLAVIRVNPQGEVPDVIRREGDALSFGKWRVKAVLDASRPAELWVENTEEPTVFSYSTANPVLDGSLYPRQYRGSSLLYDATPTGEYQVSEQTDYEPIQTRNAP